MQLSLLLYGTKGYADSYSPALSTTLIAPQASLTRSSTPPPRTNIPQGEGSDVAAGNDDEKLGQLSAMMTDVKVVVRQITLMWHEEISACAGLPENVPLEGESISCLSSRNA